MFKSIKIHQDIIEKIQSYDIIIIHRHVRPDPDAIGSQNGLKEAIKASYPDKEVYAVGSDVGDLDFLAVPDEISNKKYKGALVIVTDTANVPRISDKRYNLGDALIKIDHHPLSHDGEYGDIQWVQDSASSCSEMVADLILSNPESFSLNDEASRLLYAGMVGDTNRFLYDSTSPQTMRVAAELMEYEFSHTALNDRMNKLSENEIKLISYLYDNIEILPSGMASLIFSQEAMKNLGVSEEDTSAVIALARNIKGVMAWGVFVEKEEGYYRCRLRSNGPAINGVAAAHGGGGHALASGANAKDLEEVEEIIKKISDLLDKWN